jgi:hypothetical protein
VTDVRFIACPQPFSIQRIEKTTREGATVEQMIVDHLGVSRDLLVHMNAIVTVSNPAFTRHAPIPREMWGKVRPKAHTTVTVRVVPTFGGGGGKKSPLRLILTLAVMAASIYLGGAPFLAEVGKFAVLGFTFSAGQIIGAAVVGLPGSVAMNVSNPQAPE